MAIAVGNNKPPSNPASAHGPEQGQDHGRRLVRNSASKRLGFAARNRVLRLGRSRWTSNSLLLVLLAIILTLVGLTFVASASSVSSLHKTGNSWTVFNHQLVFVITGVLALAISSFVPYRIWKTIAAPLFFGASAATFISAFFGVSRNGSRRWIALGGQLIQPSEFLKLGSVLFFALIFTKRASVRNLDNGRFLWRTILPVAALAGGPILLQPDMGTASIVIFACAAVVVVGGFPMRKLAPLLIGFFTFGSIYALSAGYRRDRITTFFHPESDPSGLGWHVTQSKIAFGSGRLFGLGIGASRAKWGWVPNAHTDFVFAVIGEEIGLIGATLVLLLFVAIAVIGFSVVNSASDRFGSLVAAGITTWVISQACFNMGTVLGLVPVTGVPLPFVSSGGSSFMVVGVAFGILVNIARHQHVNEPAALPTRVRQAPTMPHLGAKSSAKQKSSRRSEAR